MGESYLVLWVIVIGSAAGVEFRLEEESQAKVTSCVSCLPSQISFLVNKFK